MPVYVSGGSLMEGRALSYIGVWCNGNIPVSKTVDVGSIPATPALNKMNDLSLETEEVQDTDLDVKV